MLPEAGATELIFIAAVALIVVGPKDLPALLRKVGQFTAKMRGLAAEFRASFDELARQSELDELRREVDALRTGQYVQPVAQEIDRHFDDLHKEFGAAPPPAFQDGQVMMTGPDSSPALAPPQGGSSQAGPQHAMLPIDAMAVPPSSTAPSSVVGGEEAWPQLDLPLASPVALPTGLHEPAHQGARETAG